MWGYVGEVTHEEFLLGKSIQGARVYLYPHLHFSVGYNNDQIVSVNVTTDPKRRVDITEIIAGQEVRCQLKPVNALFLYVLFLLIFFLNVFYLFSAHLFVFVVLCHSTSHCFRLYFPTPLSGSTNLISVMRTACSVTKTRLSCPPALKFIGSLSSIPLCWFSC